MSSMRIRTQRHADYVELKLLISHPMENGRNRDASGVLIAAHFIQELEIHLNGDRVVYCELAGGVSQNPYFNFRLRQARIGDRITATWRDNQQQSDTASYLIES